MDATIFYFFFFKKRKKKGSLNLEQKLSDNIPLSQITH